MEPRDGFVDLLMHQDGDKRGHRTGGRHALVFGGLPDPAHTPPESRGDEAGEGEEAEKPALRRHVQEDVVSKWA